MEVSQIHLPEMGILGKLELLEVNVFMLQLILKTFLSSALMTQDREEIYNNEKVFWTSDYISDFSWKFSS